jgi:hypothetical protein
VIKKQALKKAYDLIIYVYCLAFIGFLFFIFKLPEALPVLQKNGFWLMYAAPFFMLFLVLIRQAIFKPKAIPETEEKTTETPKP